MDGRTDGQTVQTEGRAAYSTQSLLLKGVSMKCSISMLILWLNNACFHLVISFLYVSFFVIFRSVLYPISYPVPIQVSRYSHFKISDLENVGKDHDVQHSQWRHSMANAKLSYLPAM